MARAQSKLRQKRPGKTAYAGRRRPSTRKSGFHSHEDSTGGELQKAEVSGWHLEPGEKLMIDFEFPGVKAGTILGFGGWYNAPADKTGASIEGFEGKTVLTAPMAPDWSKFGSQWFAESGDAAPIRFVVEASKPADVYLWGVQGGVITHQHLTNARPALMKNMHSIAPEANFIDGGKHANVSEPHSSDGGLSAADDTAVIHLKSCNRCARFLPVNLHTETAHLSFTNHCSAPHRRPCSHPGFGRLRDVDTDETVQLDYGFQLECRFCKKFEVNAPHNPQRTSAQMKEDGARRRAFELLLTELYGGSANLNYRHETGSELADDVWENFEHRCFKCGTPLATSRDMQLDHTRPLALLWPLDGTATALCATHNSEKRDRAPVDYYDDDELRRLAKITGLPLEELCDPSPNLGAIKRLQGRLDWFFDEFLQREELQTERDGKLPADLLVKALGKVLNRVDGGPPFDIRKEQGRRSA